MLKALIETYLHESGFVSTEHDDGRPTHWWHYELGGRTFEQCVAWQIGRELAVVRVSPGSGETQ